MIWLGLAETTRWLKGAGGGGVVSEVEMETQGIKEKEAHHLTHYCQIQRKESMAFFDTSDILLTNKPI